MARSDRLQLQVLLIGPYPPPQGGVETHLVAVRRFLLDRGVGTQVINITRHRKVEVDGIFYPKNAVDLVRRLLTLKYDLIHLHFGGNLSARLLALSLVSSCVPRAKTVLTFHSGGYPSSPPGRAASYWTASGFVLRRFDHLIAVNAELADMFERFGVARQRISIIAPHAVPPASPRADIPAPLADFFERHHPALLTVGGLEPEYAVPLQIDMLGHLLVTRPNAGLAVVGRGSLENEIRDYARSKPWSSNILVCGDVQHDATLRAIAKADLLLRPTLYDGDSIAVREALHFGTPVLATDNGMRPKGVELITDPIPESLAARAAECLSKGRVQPSTDTNANENLDRVLATYLSLRPDRTPGLPETANAN